MATMVNAGSSGDPDQNNAKALFHANPGHGTPAESSLHRTAGLRGRSEGRQTEERYGASVVLNGHNAYSYSCLSKVPQPGFMGSHGRQSYRAATCPRRGRQQRGSRSIELHLATADPTAHLLPTPPTPPTPVPKCCCADAPDQQVTVHGGNFGCYEHNNSMWVCSAAGGLHAQQRHRRRAATRPGEAGHANRGAVPRPALRPGPHPRPSP